MMLPRFLTLALVVSTTSAYDGLLGFSETPEIETRTIGEIYKAALEEGGVVTCWHGGDEANRHNGIKQAFEKEFPGMTLNITVDLSKYLDGRLDQQFSAGKTSVYIDSIILQSLHDYPRWDSQGALLHYIPRGFDQIWPPFKVETGAWYGVFVSSWAGLWNSRKLPDIKPPEEWNDWLRPEFKDRLVLTYPHDDDAILFTFYLVMRQYGVAWFDALLDQHPRWVRGSATPGTIIAQQNSTRAATFTSSARWNGSFPIKVSRPVKGQFVSWPQTAAILADAPHPQGAKLLHNFYLTKSWQTSSGRWPVRMDVDVPEGFPDIMHMEGTNPTEFARFMADRELVERLKLYFEDRLGHARGAHPVQDGL